MATTTTTITKACICCYDDFNDSFLECYTAGCNTVICAACATQGLQSGSMNPISPACFGCKRSLGYKQV